MITTLMKKNLSIALLVLVIGLPLSLLAQNRAVNRCSYVPPRHADNWFFFQNAGLRFTDATGTILNNLPNNNLPVGKGTAVYSDEDGNLLLYTDGIRVWNKNHEMINFGPNLAGDLGSTQSSIIVQNPVSKQMLYVFTTDIQYPAAFGTTKGFNYSRVDLTLGNGAGAVTTDRDINLLPKTAEMISGVKTADGNGYWVVTHGLGNNNFYAYKVDNNGVNTTPVVSSSGSSLNDDYSSREGLGAMKISPKGDRIAYASFGKGIVEVFSFNSANGTVSNPLLINPETTAPNQGPYYVEFSPDGTKLYVTVVNLSTGRENILYQYDLSNSAEATVLNESPLNADPSALQLGRDGKIYVTRYQRDEMGVIENPNRPGTYCNYKESQINLGGKRGQNGLPTFIQSFFDIPPFDYDTKCDGDETLFTIHNTANIDNASWDFGDAGNTTPGAGLNPVHVFSAPGTYNVTLTELYGGQSFTSTSQVVINQLPPKSFIPDSLYIFPGSIIPLDAGADMFDYRWQDGSNNRFYDVANPGLYVAEYTDINCCTNSDSLLVIALDISLPNAFSPNGDNLNDYFKAMGPSDGIQDYTLVIYNRWGQLVWEATNFSDSWDGTYKGENAPAGIYAWYMTFNVIGNVSSIGKVKYKGSVTLLR
jgi:gliding motility-associated-like protein